MKTLLLSITLLLSLSLSAQNAAQNCSTVANCGSCTGSYTWNTSSAFTPTILFSGGGFAKDLQSSNYGFNIPSTGSITGISVMFVHSSVYSHPTALVDTLASLLKGGVVSGNSKHSLTGPYNSTTTANVTLGGTGDLWGTTWTPADINASNFGFNFKLYLANVGNVDLKIWQGIIINVYYLTPSGIIESQTKTSAISNVKINNSVMGLTDFEKLDNPTLQVFDLTGKQILNVNPIETPSIDLSFLETGVYFYQIKSVQENRSKKFIITK